MPSLFNWKFRSLNEFDVAEGTVTLVDESRQTKTIDDLVLVPQPSDDINDPLNWSKLKKIGAFLPVLCFTFCGNWAIAGLAVAIPELMTEFGRGLNDTAQGFVGYPVLGLGLGNFFWIPLALWIGKRPTFLIAVAIFFATVIWAAKAETFHSLLASRVIAGVTCACTEGLASAINADLFFLHERGFWMGIYVAILNLGPTLGSLMSTFIIQSLGWRWHFWVCSIVVAINLVMFAVFFPETTYVRAPPQTPAPSESGEMTDAKVSESNVAETNVAETHANGTLTGTKRTFVQDLNPWPGVDKNANFIHLLIRPFPLIFYPAVFVSFLIFSTTLSWDVVYLDTAASVYHGPPFNFSVAIIGLYNIAAIIAIPIGAFCGGWLTDWIAQKWARRNNGIYEPEYRLIALILPFFLVPVGLLMYGFGIQRKEGWAIGYCALGFLIFGLTSIPSIVLAYVIDSYLPVAFEALLLVNGLKNVFAFGISFAVVPWILGSGYRNAFGEMVAIQTGTMLLFVPLFLYGKKLRHISWGWKVISW